FFFFFFSSRRRHTRSDRDWSSDVCSSDLVPTTSIASSEGFSASIEAFRQRSGGYIRGSEHFVKERPRWFTLRVEAAKFAAKERAKPQNKQIHRGLRLPTSTVRRENRGLAQFPTGPGSSRKK